MDAAGILRDIPADCAGDLARGVRSVVVPIVAHFICNPQIGNTGLDHSAAIIVVNLQNFLELTQSENNPVGERQCATGQRSARATRHHLDRVFVAIPQYLADLFGRLRQHDD